LSGRISLFTRFAYLPLLHTLVEERVGERRLLFRWEVHGEEVRSGVPLSLALSPLGGARGRNPTISKEVAGK